MVLINIVIIVVIILMVVLVILMIRKMIQESKPVLAANLILFKFHKEMDDISKIDFDTYDDDDDVIEIATKKNNKMIKMMTMMVDLPRCWIFKRTTDSTWEPTHY